MINIARHPDDITVISDEDTEKLHWAGVIAEPSGKKTFGDATVRTEERDGRLYIYLNAKVSHPQFICMRWKHKADRPVYVLGDSWERGYGNFSWQPLCGEQFMPWYFIAKEEGLVTGCGVETMPNSFVCFEYDAGGVSGWFDVRCGGIGVDLSGRELLVATVVCRSYENLSAFDAAKDFCKVMCKNGIRPAEPVYGGNNWYYAYGKSSGEEIRNDAKLIASLAEGNKNRPYMVIDDGWQKNTCAGPWEPNARFEDMRKIADDMKETGVKPGIWVRLLHDTELLEKHPDWALKRENGESNLDPSVPEVLQYVREVTERIKSWGYMLLKHDYSTFDIFGDYGFNLNGMITAQTGWSFYDKTKTSAEIVTAFYKAIREAAGDMVIIGCNTVSHLCAGLVEINRAGDDTSGKLWCRTRVLGVNTLAFRMPQNHIFYDIDADCVGILGNNIPWELNSQWLELLAKSGTPLFISCRNGALGEAEEEFVKECFRISSKQSDTAIPLDWEYNTVPEIWEINGEKVEFDWERECYPALLKGKYIPM